MGAVSPSSTLNLGPIGDSRLMIVSFASVSDTDTWTSGLTGIVKQWVQVNANPTTQTSAGIAVTQSSGVFTFYPGENSNAVDLYVLVRS